MEKDIISYQEYGEMVEELYNKVKRNDFVYLHGIARGGLPIAVHLSHFLNVPMLPMDQILDLCMGEPGEENEIPNDEKPTILVVDDICDTGKTIDWILTHTHGTGLSKWVNIKTAVLFHKPHSPIEPDYYVAKTTEWIVFPWENINEKPNRDMYEHLGGSE